MSTNLRLYHTILHQIRQWWPEERVTRQRNMALLITGLFLAGRVHLSRIVGMWPSRSKGPSLVNRLRRFLGNPRLQVWEWYRPVAEQLLALASGPELHLIIDCTKVGFAFRLMTVSLAYKRRSLPLVWSVHRGSRGWTSVQAQQALLRRLLPLIPAHRSVVLLGDAGFQSVELLGWLRRQGWHFVIRQQGKIQVYSPAFGWRRLDSFALEPGQTRVLGWVRLTRRRNVGWFWLVLHWEAGEDAPWYLASSRSGRGALIRLYKKRMWTEEMYGDWKGHGFDLEASHLRDPDRIDRLVLAVALTFLWLIALGSVVVKRGQRHLVDHRSRRDKSYFRIGWDWTLRCLRLDEPVSFRLLPYP